MEYALHHYMLFGRPNCSILRRLPIDIHRALDSPTYIDVHQTLDDTFPPCCFLP